MTKPEWLRVRIRSSKEMQQTETLMRSLSLHTVCEEAACPNRMECFGRRTATFLILGKVCTRNCTFCNVSAGIPSPPDSEEPRNVARAAQTLGLQHVVVTSVTRDDLPDGGSGHYSLTIREIRTLTKASVEVLVPDFQGQDHALLQVLEAHPDVLNHNLETVPRLYPAVRPGANYHRSLNLLQKACKTESNLIIKSGIMVGLGETRNEVLELLEDLAGTGCQALTIGQYLAPSKMHLPVAEYLSPELFDDYRDQALSMGFRVVASGPFVRSSYRAETMLQYRPNSRAVSTMQI